jgi:hypothetical protein
LPFGHTEILVEFDGLSVDLAVNRRGHIRANLLKVPHVLEIIVVRR